jgi:rod shape determining protein RodA
MQDSIGSSVQGFSEPRMRVQRLDWLLLLAAVGLIAFSVYTLSTATENDVEGSPHYFVIRQAVYGVVGILLMLLVARFDYSRIREWRAGLYVLMIGSILLVFTFGGVARGSKRAIELPFFSFQASELGKVLLILALAAFVLDRVRSSARPRPRAG